MKNLKEMRKESGYTQATMAEFLHISQQTYSDYENSKTFPDEAILIKIADVLSVSVDYLLGRTDDLGAPILPSAALSLTAEEKKLIQDYRGLAQPLKDMIQSLIKTWQGQDAEVLQRRKNT